MVTCRVQGFKNVSSNIFGQRKETKNGREPFQRKFFCFRYNFQSKITNSRKKLSSKTNYTKVFILIRLIDILIKENLWKWT
ncbi:hypothetical protein DMB65_01180 [Flavobacterium cheongpyeongense]|uniref:Uncharacterized protein n=1 Tax=Flavobacterium cheongpyeongense TaxID=2212651 RepID=A0A2V4BVK5_9FLAO|nr:hypothetical protein DMB65_01180 [Flavobacterium cheongpyeongense]